MTDYVIKVRAEVGASDPEAAKERITKLLSTTEIQVLDVTVTQKPVK